MDLEKVYKKNSEVIFREIEGEAVLLHIETGYYYSLNDTGSFIWNQINGKRKLKTIVKNFLKEYQVDEKTFLKDLKKIINDLKKEKLIVEN